MSAKDVDLDGLLGQLERPEEPIAYSSLYNLSDLHGEELERLCSVLSALPSERRQRLLRALVELGESSFEVSFDAIFLRCLDDEDQAVRSAAIDGLWEDTSPNLVGPFLTMLRSDPSPRVRAAAARGLGRFVLAGELEELEAAAEQRIVHELLAVLHLEGENTEVRRRALESMGYACLPEVTEALELAFDGEDEEMRLSAIVGMGRSCDRRWEDILLDELRSDVPAMRYEAALASGELILDSAVPRLGHLLNDADREVSNAAIWALGQIGGHEARELLLGAYEAADEDTQAAIDEALAEQVFVTDDWDAPFYGLREDEETWLGEQGGEGWDDSGDEAGWDASE